MRLRYGRDSEGNLQERFGRSAMPDLVIEELPPDLVPELLRTQPVARIALRVGDRVHIVPVNHHVDSDGAISFRTAPGRKLDLAQRGAPTAVLEGDHGLDRLPGWFVTVVGQLTPVLDQIEIARLERTELRTYADADPRRREHWLRLRPSVQRAYRVVDAATSIPTPSPLAQPRPAPKPGIGQLEELTESECLEVLGETHIGRFARLAAGEPRLAPVTYELADGALVLTSVIADRLDDLDPDEVVVVQVDVVDEATWSGSSVIVEGRLERVSVRDGHISEHVVPDEPWSFPVSRDQLLQLRIEALNGRRIVREA